MDEQKLAEFLDLVEKFNGGREVRQTLADLIDRLRQKSFETGYDQGYETGYSDGREDSSGVLGGTL